MQIESTGLNARHVQQVVHQAGGIEHVLANFIRLRGIRGTAAGKIERQNFSLTKQHGERRSQVMRKRRQERVAQAFPFADKSRLFFAGGER